MPTNQLVISISAALAAAVSLCASASAEAQQRPVLLRESFPIGDGGGILCQVQDRSVENPAKQSIFDRSWAIVCRDSAQPVANVYAFRDLEADGGALVAPCGAKVSIAAPLSLLRFPACPALSGGSAPLPAPAWNGRASAPHAAARPM